MERKLFFLLGGLYFIKNVIPSVVNEALTRISYRFESIKFKLKLLEDKEIQVELRYSITNDNPLGFTINNFDGSLYYSGSYISDVVIDEPFSIAANTTREITIDLFADIEELPFEIIELIKDKKLIGKCRIQGVLNTSVGLIPIDEELSIL